MPALPPTPNVIRLRTIGNAYGVTMGNRFFVQYAGPGLASSADISSLCSSLAANLKVRLFPWVSQNYHLTSIVGEDLTSTTAATGQWNGINNGSATLTAFPASLAAVISWNINRRYRGGKPRTYLGPLDPAIVNTGNRLLDTTCSSIAAGARNLMLDIAAVSLPTIATPTLGTVSFFTGKTLRTSGVFEPFTGARVNDRPGSQRRRTGKLAVYDT